MKNKSVSGKSLKSLEKSVKNRGGVRRGGTNANIRAYYALAVVFAAVIVLILCLTLFFRISKIQVEGVTLYREDQIINVSGISQEMNLMRTDTGKAESRLLDNLVYIDSVEVKKKFPSTIVISCKEAEKAADIECNGAYYVVSTSGRILEAKNPKRTKGIPVVSGFELSSLDVGSQLESSDGYKAKILTDILESFSKHEFGKVNSIDMKSRADIILGYDNRITIKLGSSADISYKLSYFKAVIDALTPDYEGTLIYNGAESGISAIPKEQELDKPIMADDSSKAENSSSEAAADAWSEWNDGSTWENTDTNTDNSGYADTETDQTQDEDQWAYDGTEDNTDGGYGYEDNGGWTNTDNGDQTGYDQGYDQQYDGGTW